MFYFCDAPCITGFQVWSFFYTDDVMFLYWLTEIRNSDDWFSHEALKLIDMGKLAYDITEP